MSLPTTYHIGPHAFRVEAQQDEGGGWAFTVWYCLYHANGYTEKPRPGVPNSSMWKASYKRFTSVPDAFDYAMHILRPSNARSDDKE